MNTPEHTPSSRSTEDPIGSNQTPAAHSGYTEYNEQIANMADDGAGAAPGARRASSETN